MKAGCQVKITIKNPYFSIPQPKKGYKFAKSTNKSLFRNRMEHPIHILYLIISALCCACTGPLIEEVDQENSTPNTRDTVAIIHEGTYTSPYSIGEAQTLGHGKEVWIEGYIVGTVKGSMKKGCNYTSETVTAANIILADTLLIGNTDDYLYCLPIELPSNSIEREELNLCDNPELHHRKLRIQGDLSLYYSVVGLRKVSDYSFNEEDESEEEDDDENDDNEEDNSRDSIPTNSMEHPLSIAEGIRLQSEDEYIQVWIRGYIIGYATGSKSINYMDNTDAQPSSKAKTNIVLADNIEERDYNKVIVVELPKGHIRSDVNLYENPNNLHRRLTVNGRMAPYYELAGCRETLGKENKERYLLE